MRTVADYSRREVVTRHVEFVVPAEEPYGACWNEVTLALHCAIRELKAAGRVGECAEPADDLIRFRVGDDRIIICYEVEQIEGSG